MKFFYSASVMGYGDGRWWHKYYNFPDFPRVTKTLTFKPKTGIPFAVLKFRDTVWNKIGLHNIGYLNWFYNIYNNWCYNFDRRRRITVSLSGTDDEIERMLSVLDLFCDEFAGIELNFSCSNVKNNKNKQVPYTELMKRLKCPLYLKLGCHQDPYAYDLNNVTGIRLNSIPWITGALSGKAARKGNWAFIEQFNKEGLNVAGCSFTDTQHLNQLRDLGCTEVGIGSVILTNPKLVEQLRISREVGLEAAIL